MQFTIKEKLLKRAGVYTGLMNVLATAKLGKTLVEDYIQPSAGCRILDVGCGPAAILGFLNGVDYTGIDHNPRYIASAHKKYGNRGKFICAGVAELSQHGLKTFDRITILGVLHHLDDEEVTSLMKSLDGCLAHNGILVTFDPAYEQNQNPVARYLAEHDRGRFVRTKQQYLNLMEPYFQIETADIRRDLLRVPYTHFITRSTARSH